ncbi:MAG TPA: glycosyltransferase family 9 protein [Steroidobacteraceae bacterium]|nr:glycosyltransferase family 9 protein [Steroidobacteraceae bacterium]
MRLSSLGDTCHVVPVVRALQRSWPQTKLTWIIGKAESRLMDLIDGVEFITVDKRAGLAARRDLRACLQGRRFDVLLHMQLSLRASLVSSVVRAPIRIGFDRARARELQWLFTNARIAPRSREHVLDSFFGFLEAVGIHDRTLRWDVPLTPEALEYAQTLIPDARPTLVISPCSSHSRRNWRAEAYAAVADHAVERHGMRVILAGGRTATERDVGAAIEQSAHVPVQNQIGRDTLPQMLALLSRATVLLSPDSGPAHMATMVGTPVIGLYAATNPERSGPYLSLKWCVNAYPQAALRFRGRPAEKLPWWEKIEEPGVMDLIEVPQVTAKLDELLAYGL